jgi:sensor c-di-GMP phosphodiesterase-like protein
MSDPDQAGATLNQLAKLGVGVALDDFGRGHSSLLYLLQLPVSRLKIDKLFISSVPDSDEHVKLTRAIIGLSKTLGKAVVAEGVETQAQLEFLLREGCLCCQGWLFSKAVPPFELPAVLERLKAAGLL